MASVGARPGLGLGRGPVMLVAAAVLVGVAIVADGAPARLVNGLGGIAWLAAGGLLLRSLWRSEGWPRTAVVALGVVVVLAVAVRPRDLALAVVGFAIGGAVVAAVARERVVAWALLVPAAWLPAHLAINVARSVLVGATRVRTDPPPTAALVPLAMVLAAGAGGAIIARISTANQRSHRMALDAAAD